MALRSTGGGVRYCPLACWRQFVCSVLKCGYAAAPVRLCLGTSAFSPAAANRSTRHNPPVLPHRTVCALSESEGRLTHARFGDAVEIRVTLKTARVLALRRSVRILAVVFSCCTFVFKASYTLRAS
jgi:hypothetical protein